MGKRVIIIGGGVAGMSAAITLKMLGCDPLLIEKSNVLGGVLNSFSKTLYDDEDTGQIIDYFSSEITNNDIKIVLCTEVIDVKKLENSNFKVFCSCGDTYEADALVIATGIGWCSAYEATEFGYGVVDNVLTLVEIEEKIQENEVVNSNQQEVKDIAIIHNVGSQNVKYGVEYCSELNCLSALKTATRLKKLLGESANVYEFYSDMLISGESGEKVYKDAKDAGVNLIRGGVSEIKPLKDRIELWAEDTILQEHLRLTVDIVVLAMEAKGRKENIKFGESLGLNTNKSAHFVKPKGEINSVKTAQKNIFTIGCANSPKNLEEAIHDGESVAIAIFKKLLKTKL